MVKKKRVKKHLEKVDGLGPHERKKIRAALRQVWHRSYARKLAVTRALDGEGFSRCELCRKRNPGNKIDHIKAVGEVDDGFIRRLFVPSKYLQAICHECHKTKTKMDRKQMAELKKLAVKKTALDFY